MKQILLFIGACLLISFTALGQKSFGEGMSGYVRIPAGKRNSKNIPAFYMSATEVTNLQYREFLDALRAAGDTARLRAAWPDSSQWDRPIPNPEWKAKYFYNKAYDHYPVVCVPKRGAYLYCEWLAARIKKNGRNLHVTLPTEEQWEYAARGGDSAAAYPWPGSFMRATSGKWKGAYLANFFVASEPDRSPVDTTTAKGKADITAPAESYLPNGYGLYNMAGNVAEMIADHDYAKGGSYLSPREKVRIDARNEFTAASGDCTVGFRPVVW